MLGEDLVRRPDARRDPGSGVGNPHRFEQFLHRSVLAVAPMQRDERDFGPHRLELLDQIRAHVDRDDLVAEPLERILDPGAGPQRHLTLQRAPALEDGYAHQARLRGSRSTFASRSSCTGGGVTGGGLGRAGLAGAAGVFTPVRVPYSATCSRTTSPSRRTPSRIWSSPTPE